jgi:tRNA A37 threonylcarbamoyladenosine synthetase subunit TsaC/SUA5/YrdC
VSVTGLDHVLDEGERRGNSVSTVVEFSKGRATVLRVGAIATDVLARLIPMVPMEE